MYDVKAIRNDFPILEQKVFGHPLLYFDSAATMQMPSAVLDAIADHYRRDNANVHRGIHTLSERSTRALEDARSTVASFIHAKSSDEIVFTSGTTDAINMLVNMWGFHDRSGAAIATTMMEHHSNFVPWQQLCKRTGRDFLVVPIDENGDLDLGALARLLEQGNVSLLAVAQVSNVLGTVNPIGEIVDMAHAHGAKVLVDAAQSVRHEMVDVQELGCDMLAFSGHKIGGPTGIGALYIREGLLEEFAPVRFGGEMVEDVRVDQTTFAPLPLRFEAGTPNYVGAIGLASAIRYLEKVGRKDIRRYEQSLVDRISRGLSELPSVRVLGNPKKRAGCVSFTVDGVHPFDLATLADKLGLAIRSGNQCAQPLLYEAYDVQNVSRLSPAFYNTADEVDQAIDIINRVIALLRGESALKKDADEPLEYRWEWISYPHGNQELVEHVTDSCLEQLAPGKDQQPRFLLSRRNEDNSFAHWIIELGNEPDPNWFETLKSKANEILDDPEGFPQSEL